MDSAETTASTAYADEPREVYPNAQLQLVAVEVRYPFAPRLDGGDALPFFLEKVREDLPIAEPLQEHTVLIGAEGQPNVRGQSSFRLASRDRTTAATVSPSRLLLETTDYERYGKFRRLLTRLIEALEAFGAPPGVERIGLRYIDEIRVPAVTSAEPAAWKRYVHESLVAPTEVAAEALPGMQPRSTHGILQFEGSEQTLVVRYGSSEGYAVDPRGALRVKRSAEPGPFFLFDIDSFWSAKEVIADFDTTDLLSTCDRLHRPISSVFEQCITDRLRDEVLRKEPIGARRGGSP
jgi:uncharacterized protein (TIGR04255 family)